MKTLLSFAILAAVAVTAVAQPEEQGFRTTVTRKKTVKVEKPAPLPKEDVQGVLPRAFRGGNPLQMLNPFAPKKYGTGEQSLAYNPISGKYDQIKLVEIVF